MTPIWEPCNCPEIQRIGCDELRRSVVRVRGEAQAVAHYLAVQARAFCGLMVFSPGAECLWAQPCLWHLGRRYLAICLGDRHLTRLVT